MRLIHSQRPFITVNNLILPARSAIVPNFYISIEIIYNIIVNKGVKVNTEKSFYNMDDASSANIDLTNSSETTGTGTDTGISTMSSNSHKKNLKNIELNTLSPQHPVYGKYFPLWVPTHFKDFILKDFETNPDVDPCATSTERSKEHMMYQHFLGKYLSYDSPLKNILLYHGVGMGKTKVAVNYILTLHKHNPNWNIVLLLKASLQRTWEEELEKWLEPSEYEMIRNNITMINYDGPTAGNIFLNRAMRDIDQSKKFLYIIEESHIFISNVFNNVVQEKDGNAKRIYDFIMNHSMEQESVRIMCITATPIINHPYELALTMNLLRPNTFPDSLNQFNDIFVSNSLTINPERQNQFSRRIMGLVDYYKATPPGVYAKRKINSVDLRMTNYQYRIYKSAEDKEKGERGSSSLIGGKQTSSSFKFGTRTASNFVFPSIDEDISGEKRPRPNKSNVSTAENMQIMAGHLNKLLKSSKNSGNDDSVTRLQRYHMACLLFLEKTRKYFLKLKEEDKKNGRTIEEDLAEYKILYNDSEKYSSKANVFNTFLRNIKFFSTTFKQLHECSPKMTALLFNMMAVKGKVLMYSSFVAMEGIEVFKIYLKLLDVHDWRDSSSSASSSAFLEYHGNLSREERNRQKDLFNAADNVLGEKYKVMLIGPAGQAGITFYNVTQIHILEPHWNETTIEQIIGRGIRFCSHKDLPIEDREVDIFRYKILRPKKVNEHFSIKLSTDSMIQNLSQSKQNLIDSFLKATQSAAVTCELYKNHNMIQQSYSCFKF